MGPKGRWASWKEGQGVGGEPHKLPHPEGQDEDDARNGGDADEPAPPDGGDDHRGQADDEQGASEPEDLGRKWKVTALIPNTLHTAPPSDLPHPARHHPKRVWLRSRGSGSPRDLDERGRSLHFTSLSLHARICRMEINNY